MSLSQEVRYSSVGRVSAATYSKPVVSVGTLPVDTAVVLLRPMKRDWDDFYGE